MHVIQLAQATATVCLGYSAATFWARKAERGSLAWPGWLYLSTLKTLAATEAKASQVSQGGTYKWPDLAEHFQTKWGQAFVLGVICSPNFDFDL